MNPSTFSLDEFHFSQISLLITHYNRSESLQRLLLSFENLKCTFGEIIVSDDGSKKEHIDAISAAAERFDFKLITAKENFGLGNNINKGQDAVTKKHTLYIQEDFEPSKDFPECLRNAEYLFGEDEKLDIIKFYAYINYPYLEKYKFGFSRMYLPFLATNYKKIYQYSDHPHLRRSSFFTKFGRYPEGIEGDKTEYKMCVSFLQNKGKGLFYNHYDKLFVQQNTESEPSTMRRGGWKESNNLITEMVRNSYRQIKYNYDIQFMKPLTKKQFESCPSGEL